VPHYMLTREVLLHQGAIGFATHYAERNVTYLPGTGISPRSTRIVVNNTTKTVYVQMTADVLPLFPEFLQVRPISAWGEAQVRIRKYWARIPAQSSHRQDNVLRRRDQVPSSRA